MESRHHVIIIGGGFGGLYAAQALKKTPVQVTLIDRRNFHLFQPLLYQVAAGQLSPANIAAPLRAVLKRQKNTEVLLAEVVDFDVENRRVLLSDGEVGYDTLVVATGARHHYFGHPEWEQSAPGLKTIEDATEIRRRVLLNFEAAERETDPDHRHALLTFILVGGGPTGVELAGTLGELSRHTLRGNFRHFNPASATILLIEATDRILPTFPHRLSAKAAAALARLGVTVRTGTVVTDIQGQTVTLRTGDQTESISVGTILWTAGVQGSPLGQLLAKKTGTTVDRAGRVVVQPNLSLPGHPEIFVIGDLASYSHQDNKPLPGIAPVAMQQGRYVAKLIEARLRGEQLEPFRYKSHGNMATIGRAKAVADLGWIGFSGLFAWLAWLFIHIIYLIEFGNRVLVVFQWAWNYFTQGRSARLITGANPFPLSHGGTPTSDNATPGGGGLTQMPPHHTPS